MVKLLGQMVTFSQKFKTDQTTLVKPPQTLTFGVVFEFQTTSNSKLHTENYQTTF
jgi:hypothetical protein